MLSIINIKGNKIDLPKHVRKADFYFDKKNNEGGDHWRFDVKAASDYSYASIEQGDEAGLLEGKVGAQLFLTWDSNGKLAKINLWYTKLNGEKQLQIHVFNAFPDGTTTDSIYE
ncbi:hypothetical protein [Paenibacillus elgii]|uniref:hypothetical protein n=1 Tax=Paenibacillus elgii TaxID=189691 RepID=UPI000248C65D|nr:hypothetical protein [Paenibacillus elgii]